MMGKWEDITDVLTKKGQKELKIGQILMFDYEGSPIHLKIMRKFKGKVWAKKTYAYTPEEADEEILVEQKSQ
jgi:hypothetical protein